MIFPELVKQKLNCFKSRLFAAETSLKLIDFEFERLAKLAHPVRRRLVRAANFEASALSGVRDGAGSVGSSEQFSQMLSWKKGSLATFAKTVPAHFEASTLSRRRDGAGSVRWRDGAGSVRSGEREAAAPTSGWEVVHNVFIINIGIAV